MVIALMAITALVCLTGLQSIQSQVELSVQKNDSKVSLLSDIRRIHQKKTIVLQNSLLNKEQNSFIGLPVHDSSSVQITLESLENLVFQASTNEEKEYLSRISELTQSSLPLYSSINEAKIQNQTGKAKTLLTDALHPIQNEIYNSLEHLNSLYKSEANRVSATTNKRLLEVQHSVLSLAGMVTLLCLLIAYKVFLIIRESENQKSLYRKTLENTVDTRTSELADENRIRRLAERKAKNGQARLATTLAAISDGVVTIDHYSNIEYLNPAAEKLLGQNVESLKGTPAEQVVLLYRYTCDTPISFDQLRKGDLRDGDSLLLKQGHQTTDVQYSVSDIVETDKSVSGSVIILRDVSEARALSQQLEHEATHDSLTGLVNRREFERRIMVALETCSDKNTRQTFFFIDLDKFKQVNDTCGHAAGDNLLQELSKRVSQTLHPNDTLARLGGDEFGVLLHNSDAEQGTRKADQVKNIINNYKLKHEDKSIGVGASIGVVEINPDIPNLEELLKMADTACYMAKENGRNTITLYTPDNEEVQLFRNEMGWVNRIRHALDYNEFKLHCQPIKGISTRHSDSTHYEVLIRMVDENNQLIFPGSFLPTAERHGLMIDIDKYVVENTFKWLTSNSVLSDNSRLSINLSGDSISDPYFLDFVVDQIEKTEISLCTVIFEITESIAVNNLENAIVFMSALGELGCEFALDDFGKGFSSLTSLKELPVDYVKIDGGFIKDVLQSQADEATVKAIIELATVLNKQTVAEFVENNEIRDKLAELGVDYVQGFGIARPASIGDVFGLEEITSTKTINKAA